MSSPLRIALAKANAATAAQLAELGRQTFHDTFAATNTPADMAAYLAANFGPELQLAELQDPANTFLLAHVQGALVGYAKLREPSALGLPDGQDPTGRLEIERLYVAEDWLGTGLGAALMRAVLALAEQLHHSAVVLGVWEKNDRARAFYQRFGFRQIGQHPFQLGQDLQTDLIMRKGLAGR
ncbi:GNAT family N-acetyltransferase [Hymenobacter caeli]|uniref:Ribosomal protein S18 acetylase RimI-like enzyme n=1 Tax=Hymenobacter caeli TaxID=2735894 RepID=A0ABX2FNQ0_9BACT|nr:GNAT family N-acetyltransferase [Hymenobacter caeli]NRT18050.1 ribosomal protein S18 acetylase RimI-like enzyme [Hymenobacter caeli]